MLCKELVKFLGINNCHARVISVSRAAEAESILNDLRQAEAIAPDFFNELTQSFDFNCHNTLPYSKSIIIAASFQPPTSVLFGDCPVIIPPTYIYSDIRQSQFELITRFLEPLGYRVARARLPLKTIAVRSGLAKYGRNNICYIPGMGSFFRLEAFYSDIPCEKDTWHAPQIMKSCLSCRECADNCPTQCISAESFVIRADRCLTHFNEDETPFPAWIETGWHNALLGCMICQRVCPLNRKLLAKTQESNVYFTKSETENILAGTDFEKLGTSTATKLKTLCLAASDVYPLLRRNLALLLKRNPIS